MRRGKVFYVHIMCGVLFYSHINSRHFPSIFGGSQCQTTSLRSHSSKMAESGFDLSFSWLQSPCSFHYAALLAGQPARPSMAKADIVLHVTIWVKWLKFVFVVPSLCMYLTFVICRTGYCVRNLILSMQSRVLQLPWYWYSGLDNSWLWGPSLCIRGCLITSLALTHQLPIASSVSRVWQLGVPTVTCGSKLPLVENDWLGI